MDICDFSFNVNRISQDNYVKDYNECLNNKIKNLNDKTNTFMNKYQEENNDLITSEETNIDTMKMYANDYYYVIIKAILYVIVLGIFIYFFGISNLIQGTKTAGIVIKDKVVEIKDKAVEIKDKALEKTK
jgi:hypothetical protein